MPDCLIQAPALPLSTCWQVTQLSVLTLWAAVGLSERGCKNMEELSESYLLLLTSTALKCTFIIK